MTTRFPAISRPDFNKRLQAACAHDVRQSPAGKGQEKFARARGENQFAVADLNCGVVGFRGELACRSVKHSRAANNLNRGFIQTFKPDRMMPRAATRRCSSAPNLSSGGGIVVNQSDGLPESAAASAAAIPAGPAPTTATSNLRCLTLSIGFYFHMRFAKHLTTAALRFSVDCDATFETRAHAAERRTRLAGHGSAASCAGGENRDSDSGAGAHGDRLSIHANGDRFRHGPPQPFAVKADKAGWESRAAGREFARILILLWRAMW